ncbi:anti-sigma factor family protein [Phenylobacterium terrae]|uniref:Anti-sigma factor family protein n=1 Tax=Phenylobacterium terrae TaxID=2665495 RepID=A0ABW4N5V8_9CAUL
MSGLKDQALMAYVDGELDETQRQALEASIAGDPQLAREVERQRALRAGVQGAFAGVLDEPVPDRLTALIAGEAADEAPLVLRPQFGARKPKTRSFRAAHWAAMAASLVLGAGIGLAAGFGPGLLDPAPIATEGGRMVARGALADALDGQLAADAAGEVQVGLSFRAQDGAYCRTFVMAGAQVAGLGCRQGEGWTVRATADAPAGQGDYRTAASATPAPILAAVEGLIAGEPLDASQEAAARARGWRE